MTQPQTDLFELYFNLREETEPPEIFYRWSLLTCLGAYLGRQFWYPFGEGRIFPNFYTMLIGHPGTRKSTAIKLTKKVISAAGYDKYSAEKTSKEKFLLDLEGKEAEEAAAAAYGKKFGKRGKLSHDDITTMLFGEEKDDKPKEPREVFIVADEFNEFVGSGNLEFLSLLGMLWDWDEPNSDYQFRLKNSKSVSIYQPTISILSGNTHAGFTEAFPPQAIGQGFLSRIILVYGEISGKRFPFPEAGPQHIREAIQERFEHIRQYVVGPATATEDAKRALSLIYHSWQPLEDGRFSHYTGRRDKHLLKLCMLIAASKGSTEITEGDVLYANTILSWTEQDMPKALGEFGKSKDSDVANKIMQALYGARKPLDMQALMRIVKNDINRIQDLADIMMKLTNSGQVHLEPGQGFLPKQKVLDSRQIYVDFPMLREYQVKFNKGLRRVK